MSNKPLHRATWMIVRILAVLMGIGVAGYLAWYQFTVSYQYEMDLIASTKYTCDNAFGQRELPHCLPDLALVWGNTFRTIGLSLAAILAAALLSNGLAFFIRGNKGRSRHDDFCRIHLVSRLFETCCFVGVAASTVCLVLLQDVVIAATFRH